VLLYSSYARVDEVAKFDEISCIKGGLGHIPMVNLMSLALAHALRLIKFGA
jgi:2,3-bisphosphoglycerate-independent phosphoglycerate mutase